MTSGAVDFLIVVDEDAVVQDGDISGFFEPVDERIDRLDLAVFVGNWPEGID